MKPKFTIEDLNQINKESLDRLRKHELIELTFRLRSFTIELYERLNTNSTNSSKPPSSDSPFDKNKKNKESANKSNCTAADQAGENSGNSDQPVTGVMKMSKNNR